MTRHRDPGSLRVGSTAKIAAARGVLARLRPAGTVIRSARLRDPLPGRRLRHDETSVTTRTRRTRALPLPLCKHAAPAATRLAPDDRRALACQGRACPPRRRPRGAHAWLVALLVVWCAGVLGTSDFEARDDLERVRERLAAVARELAEAYDDRDRLTEALAQSEKRAAGIQREIERLDGRLVAARERSDAAHLEHSRHLAELAEDREQLARAVRASYRFARRDPLAMLLDLDTPLKIDRMLAYHGLVERMHAERIRRVARTVARLEALETRGERRSGGHRCVAREDAPPARGARGATLGTRRRHACADQSDS